MRWTNSDLSAYLQRRGQPAISQVAPRRRRPVLATDRMPQARLAALVEQAYPGRFAQEVGGLVPGRRYRADLADVRCRAIVECDGWQSHGKYKEAFHRDRERDYLFTIEGYRILRIPAGLILHDPESALERIKKFVEMLDAGTAEKRSIQ